jgi:hypothetical protein
LNVFFRWSECLVAFEPGSLWRHRKNFPK